MATSAEAVVTRRPGTGCTSGSGLNRSTSTPTGTTAMRSGSTLWSATMSLNEFSDTVMIRFRRRATSVCMSTKLYQRRSVSFLYQLSAASISRRRSTVIGWWIVPSTGMPSWRSMRSSPKPRHWLSWTMSNSPWRWRRWSQARMEKARGSGKVPPMKAVTSRTSFQFFSSQMPGLPHREVVVVDVEAGELDQRDPLVEDRVRLAAEHLDVVAEVDQRLGEVAGVDALSADVGLPPVGEVGDPEGCVVGHGPTSLSGC